MKMSSINYQKINFDSIISYKNISGQPKNTNQPHHHSVTSRPTLSAQINHSRRTTYDLYEKYYIKHQKISFISSIWLSMFIIMPFNKICFIKIYNFSFKHAIIYFVLQRIFYFFFEFMSAEIVKIYQQKTA